MGCNVRAFGTCADPSVQPLYSKASIPRSVGYCTHTSLPVQHKHSQSSSPRLSIQLIAHGTCTTCLRNAGHHSIALHLWNFFSCSRLSRSSHLDKARLKLPPFFLSLQKEDCSTVPGSWVRTLGKRELPHISFKPCRFLLWNCLLD